jgi:hypothetical protein
MKGDSCITYLAFGDRPKGDGSMMIEVTADIQASFVWVSLCGLSFPLADMNRTCGMRGLWNP